MPLTDRKRVIYVALFCPVFAVVGICRAFLCNNLYRGGFGDKKLGMVQTIVRFLRFLLKILQDVVIYNIA